jgi:hypothetical protein
MKPPVRACLRVQRGRALAEGARAGAEAESGRGRSFSMFGGEPRFYKCLGESSKHSAVNYPQLLGKSVLINTPSFLRIIFGAFGIFMPKSALEKITICPAGSPHPPSPPRPPHIPPGSTRALIVFVCALTGFVRRHLGEGRGEGRGVVPLHQALGRDGRGRASVPGRDRGLPPGACRARRSARGAHKGASGQIALVKTARVRGGRHLRRLRRLRTPADACQSECRVRSQVTVGARSKEVVPFMVPAEQCEAKWELIVEDFGIGMQASPQPSSTLLHPGALAPACAITGAQVHTGQKQSNAGRA